MTDLPLYTVDAFADRAFAGNPAAVCLLPAGAVPDDARLAAIAAEMNLSETAFLSPADEGYGLRWFTPAVEVDLCGHATLASAHVLWSSGRLAADAAAVFATRSGTLTARRAPDGAIELDFPAAPPTRLDPGELVIAMLSKALGAAPRAVARSREDLLVEVEDEATVRALTPDVPGLATIDARGVIVTAAADQGRAFDFVSRFFGPRVGVPEDPVTGSAHCTLAPYWAKRLGRAELVGYQASARGGTVGVELRGDRVTLRGRAVTIVEGRLLV